MKNRAIISVNVAVLLFGLAGLFAKWIHLPAIGITFGRVFFSSMALAVYMLARRQSFRIGSRRDGLVLLLAGVILALHWWSFLEAIQLSTVAIGTITFSSFPLFVTFLEPLAFRERLRAKNVAVALALLLGVAITVPELSLGNQTARGVAVGMLSALAYAVLTVLNKSLAGRYTGVATAFYEQAVAALTLAPFVLAAGLRPSLRDVGLLALLGVFTTALAHTLFISSLKRIPARLAGVCSSMETVYGILLALLLLGETPSPREWIGAAVIVGVVLLAQLWDGRAEET